MPQIENQKKYSADQKNYVRKTDWSNSLSVFVRYAATVENSKEKKILKAHLSSSTYKQA